MTSDLHISGNACSFYCNASRWDVQNYSIVIETWIKKADLQSLRDSIRPGAVGELYKVLGRPHYYDKSWTKDNTLIISSNAASKSNLKNMRGQTLIYPKTKTTHPIIGSEGWIEVKIDAFVSGSGSL